MKKLLILLLVVVTTGGWSLFGSLSPVNNVSAATITLNPPKDWGSPSSGGTPDLTKNYYVVFDGSGSMDDTDCSGGTKYGRIVPARQIMEEFGKKLPSDVNLGLYVFDNNAWNERVPLGPISHNLSLYEKQIASVEAGNGTPLGAALRIAYEALRQQSLKQDGYGEYHIVVVTDGEANDSEYGLMDRMVVKITQTPIVLETIGFCISTGHALNQPGRTVYRNAMNPADLEIGLHDILAESNSFVQDTFK